MDSRHFSDPAALACLNSESVDLVTHHALHPDAAGCLHELFEMQVAIRPNEPALICGNVALSYAQLDAHANRLARYLRRGGAGPGRFVALLLDRSASPQRSPIVAILACLKSGAAYVPLDPAYPSERSRHILAETSPVLLLTDLSLLGRCAELHAGPAVAFETLDAELAQQSSLPISREESGLSPEDLCYVIYTSGTTGHPKGVMTEHHNAYRFVLAFNDVCATAPQERVYQGFSLGFDGSVEEMWMAFSNGSALVVGTPSAPRFGDELAQHLAASGITYFSTVPTLLSTMSRQIPSLKTLVVSGEACPPELVNRWAHPGLRMLNVYGPTEATVNTTAAECVAGRPVTIGRPLRGYHLYILDEGLAPVPVGAKGELYIGGDTLARGYLNQPAQSAERFIPAPDFCRHRHSRLYRTGDLVREDEHGELQFFGRIDSQVKLRGYRIELAEIETVLLEDEEICSASVKLVERPGDGLQELAAYVIRKEPASSQALDRGRILARLEARLPPYMLPAHLDVLESLPMLSSGKVDRARLPAPREPLVRTAAQIVAPTTELEVKIATIWTRVFGLPEVSVESDFFHELGGHSLLAAQMVTQLRRDTGLHATVRDAYNFPTIRQLARHLGPAAPAAARISTAPSSQAVFASQPAQVRWLTAALQAVCTYLLYGSAAVPLGVLFLIGRGWAQGVLSSRSAALMFLGLALGTWPVLLAVSILGKRLIVGTYQPGSYPLWGFYYFRFWLAARLHAISGAGALAGTPLMPLYYRLMGARVGRGCTIDTAGCAAWDLISIGDDTSIGADTQLLGCRVEGGMLILGRVDIGSRCFIGIHSALGLDVRMEDEARLDDQSLLADRQVIPAGQARRGSPALPAQVAVPMIPGDDTGSRRPLVFGALHLLLLELLAMVMLLPSLPLLAVAYAMAVRPSWGLAGLLLASVPAGVIATCLLIAALKRLVLSRIEPGTYPVSSALYLRKWLSDALMRLSRSLLLPVYTTLYLPPWLRLLGAKIGARAELSTVWCFAPELIDVGEESFFADGSIIGGCRLFRGHFQVGRNRIGRRSFVGNSAVLPVGAGLGERCLLGVQSLPPIAGSAAASATPDGTEWLGSPSFALPHRPKVGNFDATVTFQPTAKLYLQRALIDGLRIVIPGYLGLGSAAVGVWLLALALERAGVAGMLAIAPLASMLLATVMILATAGIKRLVMGTFRPVVRPLWSMYVWLNEMVNGIYESVMSPALAPLLGTPFVAPFLRLLGCRIGRHTYIATTLFSEFDLVEIGDHAALNSGAVIQNHLFEDRVMKSSYLKIGSGCSVGNMAVVLYDSEMQDGSVLGPLSLLMKGETLAPLGRWHGIPCMPEPAHEHEHEHVPAPAPATAHAA